jgi:ParB family protein of integrating conjugative element (PFGI_1 class)
MRARRLIVKGMDFFDDLSGAGIASESVIPIGEPLRVTRELVEFSTQTLDSRGSALTKKKKKASKSSSRDRASSEKEIGKGIGLQSLRVEIARIKCYERNPRRSKNPEFDRIKASILMSGMDQPLLITQRPGETDYIVQAGGNTRLQILKELFETTGEERFLRVDCLFVEWDRESTVLMAHLRENELRGNLTFIDRARAVFDVKEIIAKELGSSPISVRQLEGFLKDHGYSLSPGMISLMGYAVLTLLPLLPTALSSGLGKPLVERIRKLHRVGREIWCLRGAGAEAVFDAAFEALCRRHDGIDWHLESLQQAIENEIAEAAEVSIQVIRMEFDCRSSGLEPDIPDFIHEDEVEDQVFPVSAGGEASIVSEAERDSWKVSGKPGVDGVTISTLSPREQLHSGAKTEEHAAEVAIELPPEPDDETLFRRIGVQSTSRIPMGLLRKTGYRLAQRLAERHGIGTLIAPLSDNGLGFVVRDIPPASVVDQLDDELLAEVSTMWWQLMAFAEMAVAPSELLQSLLDAESALSPAALSGEGYCLTEKVWTVAPDHLAQRFWRQLNHDDWCDWLRLAHNYRELHRMAGLLNTPLWSNAT